jgi:tRNA threonylcarbamoyl adenosine modification protein YjeE
MAYQPSVQGGQRHSPADAVTRGLTVVLPDADDTRALGRALAGLLRAGDLVVLAGPLGAGKTVLAQGIGAGLGVAGKVTSPTFVLARVHRGGRVPLVHVDAYRLGSVEEVDDLDLDADLPESVTVVEWGQGLVEQLADAHLLVRLARAAAGDERTAELTGSGGDWDQRLRRLEWDSARAAEGLPGPP